MPTFLRYLIFQLPGWALAALLLGMLVRFRQLEPPLALVLFGLWMLKDFALFPFVRVGYERRRAIPGDAMVGASAIARDALNPTGYVRVGPELWRAHLGPGAAPVPAGAAVRVLAVRGLTLVVAAEAEADREAV